MKTTKKHIIICDIDGTLADLTHRRPHVEKTPKNWEKFFDPKLVRLDKLIQPVAEVVMCLNLIHPVFYVSGRREELRETTKNWLQKHGLWFAPFELRMRRSDDRRADTIVKREILEQIREEGFIPIAALDDRASVVSMWRENGVTCLQVAEGDF